MHKEIYFIFVTPPLLPYLDRYCINYFTQKNWETHIIDLSPIVNPVAFTNIKTGLIPNAQREIFFQKGDYRKYIKKTADNAVFIVTTDFNYDSYFIHRSIGHRHYGYMSRMDTNVEIERENILQKTTGLFRGWSIHRIINSILIRLPRNLLPIKAADFVILGGSDHRDEYIGLCCTNSHTMIKHIHSLDYEKYLEVRDMKERLVKEEYCVFLDQFLPYHPDNLSSGYYIDPQQYYEKMTALFQMIEKACHLKVIIAAHPRADYSKHEELKNFLIIRYKTAELVKDAEFVIAHFSTSISYAVTFQKPLVLVTTNDLEKIKLWNGVENKYALLLGKKVINISYEYKISDIISQLNIFQKKYDDYFIEYLAANGSGGENSDRPFANQLYEIVSQIIKK